MEHKYLRKDQTLSDAMRKIDSLSHNIINTNKMIGDLCERIMNLEGFMAFAEDKIERLEEDK